MKIKNYFLLSLIVLLASCANTENNKMIIGNWVGVEWLVNGTASNLDATKASFSFNEKKMLTVLYMMGVKKKELIK